MKGPFDHIGGRLGDGSAFASCGGDSSRKGHDLGVQQAVAHGDAQGCLMGDGMFPSLVLAFAACDGDGVVPRFAEEVAQADSEDAADALESLERGDHVICFELGEQGGGAVGLSCQSAECEVLRSAKHAQLQSDGIDRQRIYGSGTWQGHYREMLAPS